MTYYRVIFSVVYWVEPPPGVHSTCMHVNLDRQGMTLHPTNGRPRPRRVQAPALPVAGSEV